MTVRSSNQVTLIDLTDGYSVILTNEAHTFLGTIDAAISGQSATTVIQALQGADVVACSVDAQALQKNLPSGLTVGVKAGLTPTLTFTTDGTLKTNGSIVIPVEITDKGITINKTFSWSIAFRGGQGEKGDAGTSVTITSTNVRYLVNSDGTTLPENVAEEKWLTAPAPTSPSTPFLWTRTIVVYSDGQSTTSYSVSRRGTDGDAGTSVTITSKEIKYAVSSNGKTPPEQGSSLWKSLETMDTPAPGTYLWTRTTVNYSDGKSTTSYSVSRQGEKGDQGDPGDKGDPGEDAYSMNISSSNGTIFKNTSIVTVLTAHVYKGGEELTTDQLTKLNVKIKWYKHEKGKLTFVKEGNSLTISAGNVTNQATYTAQLETA